MTYETSDMNGSCDVAGCTNPVFMGWRPLAERLGRKICGEHWQRHKDSEDDFDLFEAFGFRRRAVIPKPVVKTQPGCCACGGELLPGRRLCTVCAAERERRRKREAYHERKSRQEEKPAEQELMLRCKACGEERQPGHTYCPKCGQERRRQSNRQRQRRHSRKRQYCVGLT
jgi:hypothetical protein